MNGRRVIGKVEQDYPLNGLKVVKYYLLLTSEDSFFSYVSAIALNSPLAKAGDRKGFSENCL
jgi:hypothetical protein